MSKEPSPNDFSRAFQIRCASKRGQYVAPKDMKWLQTLYRKHSASEWVKRLDAQVFEATAPFGSR